MEAEHMDTDQPFLYRRDFSHLAACLFHEMGLSTPTGTRPSPDSRPLEGPGRYASGRFFQSHFGSSQMLVFHLVPSPYVRGFSLSRWVFPGKPTVMTVGENKTRMAMTLPGGQGNVPMMCF